MEKLTPNLIALDLDDTLLNSELTISPYTVAALQKAADQGIYIVLCSGRTEDAILPFVRKLEIAGKETGRYLIAMNGSSVFDLHLRQQIMSRSVEPEILQYVYSECKKRNFPAQVYCPDVIYASEDNEWTQADSKLCNLRLEIVDDFMEFLKKPFAKMLVPGDPDELQIFQSFLKKEIGDKAVIFVSKPYFLEIMPLNAGKGEAIEWLANHIGIDMNKTMAFGDSMNDESMILKAGYSIAMCNGLDIIKHEADYVTEADNNHDGIGLFLEKNVLNQ